MSVNVRLLLFQYSIKMPLRSFGYTRLEVFTVDADLGYVESAGGVQGGWKDVMYV